jgi:hypothetical protein
MGDKQNLMSVESYTGSGNFTRSVENESETEVAQ